MGKDTRAFGATCEFCCFIMLRVRGQRMSRERMSDRYHYDVNSAAPGLDKQSLA